MQIVIDIPENAYDNFMILGKKINNVEERQIIQAFQNGTPLPKGHGRLIDADAFIETMKDASKRQKYKEVLIDNCLTVDDVFKAIIESIQNAGLANGDAPTIIEADNESEDEEDGE